MQRLIAFFLLNLIVGNSWANEYAISAMPASLKENAIAVKRKEQLVFEIENPGSAILKKTYAITVLSPEGDAAAHFVEYYDKLKEIKKVSGRLFDANGKEIKSLKSKDITDVSGVDDNNLMDDYRRKQHSFYYKVYPYTVEYEVTVKYKGMLFFPVWVPQDEEKVAVEQSEMIVTAPANYAIRYKAYNYNREPAQQMIKNGKEWRWEMKNMLAQKSEYASPSFEQLNTVVFLGPTDFEIQGYKGSMNSWADFGNFVYTLTKDKDVLPDEIKIKVQELIKGKASLEEKVTVLYKFLQQNTRYISVQLGIGGWQPFDAKYVARNAYGDCKALTNYMYSLLKEAGIPSHYTLIKAGRGSREVIADFPSQQFNHVILCVPNGKDTIWLECTSQTETAGYLGAFTGNRKALIVKENGSELVNTPQYTLQENLQQRNTTAVIDEKGTLRLNVQTTYHAMQQDYLHGMINGLSKEKVKEYLQSELRFSTFEVLQFNYQEIKNALPAINENLEIAVTNYATITGKRLFLTPNIMTKAGQRLSATTQRKNDIFISYSYVDVDTTFIEIPAGYKAEALPKNIILETVFGKYKNELIIAGNKITYIRRQEQYAGTFPALKFKDFATYQEAIYEADRQRIVLVKE